MHLRQDQTATFTAKQRQEEDVLKCAEPASGDRIGSDGSDWKGKARAKRAEQLSRIPLEWRIAVTEIPQSALACLRESGVLTSMELAITEMTDAATLLGKIASREFSAVEVVKAYSKRAAVAQQLVGCCTEMFFDEALERARLLDDHLAKTSQVVGPLHGLPVSLKDLIDVKGHDTTWGWVGLIDKPAESNSTLAEVLISQGAVPFCKTNLSQSIMMSDSYNHVFKQSFNSLNRNLISGGSSGGEGALVGCLGSPLGFGTDTGGSIRIPSNIQGIYGLCPSVGRVPFVDSGKRMFISPPVAGPMAPSLSTIEAAMDGILGSEPWTVDPAVIPVPWRQQLAEKPTRRLRIGYYLDDGVVLPQPPLRSVVTHVVERLRVAGHEVFEWDAKSHKLLCDHWSKAIMSDGGDAARYHCSLSGEPLIEGMIIGTENDRLTIGEMDELADTRTRHQREYLQRWRDANLDALIMPTQTFTGFRPREWVKSHQYVGYTSVWNWLGFAALAMPITTINENNARTDAAWNDHVPRNESDKFNWQSYDPELVMGMPVGIQIVGGRFGEEKAIAVAKIIEDLLAKL